MSSPWHLGPLAGFDIESTGTDVEQDRIVTACYALQAAPDGEIHSEAVTADPGIEIPSSASDIHGVTTKQAQAEGIPAAEAAAWVRDRLEGSPFEPVPLVIYNAPFDLTMADREVRRHGLRSATSGWEDRRIIDPLVLDKQLDKYRRGSRKLVDVCAYYGIKLEDAHNAEADTAAAVKLARAIARKHPAIAAMSLADLHAYQVRAKADQARSFQEYLIRKGSDEVIDPSWPMTPWTEPRPVQPAGEVSAAREQLVAAARRYHHATGAELAREADLLAIAAGDLVIAVSALPVAERPAGWIA